MSSIKGAELKLHKVFSSDFQFEIPDYQRPYSWQIEHAEELFDDLWTFREQEDKSEEYFLGSIVLIKSDQSMQADVVDGQQRLTTLTILLAAIRDRLKGHPKWGGAFDKYIMEPGDITLDLSPKPRLYLRKKDRSFFGKYIQSPGGIEELEALDVSRYKDSKLNLINNARAFQSRLADIDDELVGQFGQFIVQKCLLVLVTTENFKSAYRIFSVMNDRGLDLAPSDILKASIISSIGEHEREGYTELWEDMEERLGRDSFNDLFAHVRMIFRKEKYRRSVLDEFSDYVVKPTVSGKKLLDNVLLPYADTLEIIINRSFKSESNAQRINELIEWLHYLNNSDWIPVAMEFVRRFDNDTDVLSAHLERLERLGASLFIRGVYATPRINRFGLVLQELEEGKDLLAEGSALDLSLSERKDTLYWLNNHVYRYSGRLRLYITMRLDAFMSDQYVSYRERTKTIEHVLPQNPATDSQWRLDWDDEQRENWVDRIGNLLLLSRKKNSEASNYDFVRKKERYFRSRSGVSSFAISTDVLNHDEWTPATVKGRQKALLKLFEEKWQLGVGLSWEEIENL
ncbi:DUF262 domain-containing protein [Vreelandella piezotolerans]|uniref:DUF262 domain-containing protein n=1 Tax=Vreelandella piezotolerans TaxID=2609667 RepID=A0ABQ6XA69_9GAMM|nr:DUF262 domain-containing protein [Halomonas piezotolerans]KAE8437990.1 DUF262 domain-containing protein [Halomonas piezotolerans]QJA23017.1 DUF262 domain-containing protein [Halomonas piezotolerans]